MHTLFASCSQPAQNLFAPCTPGSHPVHTHTLCSPCAHPVHTLSTNLFKTGVRSSGATVRIALAPNASVAAGLRASGRAALTTASSDAQAVAALRPWRGTEVLYLIYTGLTSLIAWNRIIVYYYTRIEYNRLE